MLTSRVTTRTIQLRPAPPDLPFPHVNQVWLIERHTRDPTGTLLSGIAALGVTSLPDHHATPRWHRRFRPHPLGHRVAASLHWLRDTVYHKTQVDRMINLSYVALRRGAFGKLASHEQWSTDSASSS